MKKFFLLTIIILNLFSVKIKNNKLRQVLYLLMQSKNVKERNNIIRKISNYIDKSVKFKNKKNKNR